MATVSELMMRTPMRRFGDADELTGAIVFLASDAASFSTGHVLAVDGGFHGGGVNQYGSAGSSTGSIVREENYTDHRTLRQHAAGRPQGKSI